MTQVYSFQKKHLEKNYFSINFECEAKEIQNKHFGKRKKSFKRA